MALSMFDSNSQGTGWFGNGVGSAEAAISAPQAAPQPQQGIFSKINAAMSPGSDAVGAFASSGYGMLAQAILGGIGASSAYKTKKKETQRGALQGLNNQAYTAALNDWLMRKNKQETRSSLTNYDQFNTMQQIAPGYKDSYTAAPVGLMPDARSYIAGDNKNTNKKNSAAQSKFMLSSMGTGG